VTMMERCTSMMLPAKRDPKHVMSYITHEK